MVFGRQAEWGMDIRLFRAGHGSRRPAYLGGEQRRDRCGFRIQSTGLLAWTARGRAELREESTGADSSISKKEAGAGGFVKGLQRAGERRVRGLTDFDGANSNDIFADGIRSEEYEQLYYEYHLMKGRLFLRSGYRPRCNWRIR